MALGDDENAAQTRFASQPSRDLTTVQARRIREGQA
jgi:hypothetical protein